MKTSQQFWDEQAPNYAASTIKDQAGYEASLERVRAHLKPDDHVLELGCGSGMTARLLAPHVARIHATDIAPGMIAIAQEKAAEEGCETATFETATLEELAAPEGGYDAVLAFNFFHLVEDLPSTLLAARGLLKPGGLLISKTPCLSGKFLAFWPFVKVMQLFGKAPRVDFISPAGLDAAVVDAGFEIQAAENFQNSTMRHFVVAKRS